MIKIDMSIQFDLFPIVESRPLQRSVVHSKAGGANDVKRRPGGSAKTGDIAGIRGNFRFEKSNVDLHPTAISSQLLNGRGWQGPVNAAPSSANLSPALFVDNLFFKSHSASRKSRLFENRMHRSYLPCLIVFYSIGI
jgi:hypothetical protein